MAGIYVLINDGQFQKKIVQKALSIISEKTNTQISISGIGLSFFNPTTIILKDLTIADSKNDTILFSKYSRALIAKANLSKLNLKSVDFDDLRVIIKKDIDGVSNIQPIIDSLQTLFPSDTSSVSKSPFEFDLKSVTISRGYLQLATNNDKKDNLIFSDVNTNIDFNIVDSLKQNFRLNSLSLLYNNKIRIKRGEGLVSISKGLLSITDAIFSTYRSSLNIKKCQFSQIKSTIPQNVKDEYEGELVISNSQISSLDLHYFIDAFNGPETVFNISSQIDLNPKKITMSSLRLNFKNSNLIGSFEAKDYNKIQKVSIATSVDSIVTNKEDVIHLIYSLTNKSLENQLGDLGRIKFTGNINGILSDLAATGRLNTKQGSVNTNINVGINNGIINLDGNIESRKLNLGKISLNKIPLDSIAINAKISAKNINTDSANFEVIGEIDRVLINDYLYRKMMVNAKLSNNQFLGNLNFNDPNGIFSFQGEADLTKNNNVFNFMAKGENINLNKLHLIDQYPNGKLSFEINTDFNKSSFSNIDGALLIKNLKFENDGDTAQIDKLLFESNQRSINIYSNVIHGSLYGSYDFDYLGESINNYMSQFIPKILKKNTKSHVPNNFTFDFKIENLSNIIKTLKFNTLNVDTVNLKGEFNEDNNVFKSTLTVKDLDFNDNLFADTFTLNISNVDKRLICSFNINNLRKKKYTLETGTNIDFLNYLENNEISNQIVWNKGDIKLNSIVSKINGNWQITTKTPNPNKIIIDDNNWFLNFNELKLSPQSIVVNNLTFADSSQSLQINGNGTAEESEHIDINLNNINLAYIANALEIKDVVNIEGAATGKIEIRKVLNNPFAYSNIDVENLKFNNQAFDFMKLNSEWVPDESKINLAVKLISNDKPALEASGDFDIEKNWLSLDSKLTNLRLTFLRTYLNDILENIDGVANGNVRIVGPLNEIKLIGSAYVNDASFNIDYLKSSITFSDSIFLTPKGFSFPKVTLLDTERNKAILNGTIDHTAFGDMKFDLKLKLNNFKVLDTKLKDNDVYYGIAYATGIASITGNDDQINIIAEASTNSRTHLFVPLDEASEASSNSFMKFIDKTQLTPLEQKIKKYNETKADDPTYLSFNLMLHATEDAKIELIFDQTTGDIMRGQGLGNIQLVYTPDGDFKMRGNYTVTSGSYLFTLQNVVNKKFDIKNGGSITWSGSPYDATLNLDAEYRLKTSISNLMSGNISLENSRKRITVSCGMNLTGSLLHPDVKFNITLPYSDNETQRLVSDLVNNPEDVSKQVGYLLLFNQFYSEDQNTSESGKVAAVTASELVSNQLSSWLSQINDNISMGVYYRPQDALSSQEVEVNMSTQLLKNRVTINGNVGYSDQNTTSNNFIGDFELEVKLNKSGKLVAKTYTRTNDYVLRNNSPTTQGIGISFKEEFNSFRELWIRYNNAIFGKKDDSTDPKDENSEINEKKKLKKI